MAITVRLVGGLGNQLFCYFAGRYLADRLETDLVLDFSPQKHNRHLDSTLLDFELSERTTWNNPWGDLSAKALDQTSTRWPRAHDLIGTVLGFYSSPHLGFDQNLDNLSGGLTIAGYFQTHKYFDLVAQLQDWTPPVLKSKSRKFLEARGEILEKRPIVVHVRRGDYMKSDNLAIGVLSTQYFLDGVAAIQSRSSLKSGETWVFSDSPDLVRGEFGPEAETFRFFDPAQTFSAAETLSLMSEAGALVTSNSTFSYWAGMLGHSKLVVAPGKWFLGQEDPRELVPPSWLRQESRWM